MSSDDAIGFLEDERDRLVELVVVAKKNLIDSDDRSVNNKYLEIKDDAIILLHKILDYIILLKVERPPAQSIVSELRCLSIESKAASAEYLADRYSVESMRRHLQAAKTQIKTMLLLRLSKAAL
ncbi:MAG TPA: hypothetical protein DF715_09855 [Oceanicaulis sp.]|nr:hypothetical protein [Oceanicaulis sp.]